MLKIPILLFCIILNSARIASGFKSKYAIGWSLAKGVCVQSEAYGRTGSLQNRLNDKAVLGSAGAGTGTSACSKLIRGNCESTQCKKFECKGTGTGSTEKLGGPGSSGSSAVAKPKPSKSTRAANTGLPQGIAPKGIDRYVDLNGTYEYILLFDVDNTNNVGEIWYQTSFQKSTRTSEALVGSIALGTALNTTANVGGSGKIMEMFDISAGASLETHLGMTLGATVRKHTDQNISTSDSANYSIKGNSSLLLYQRCFNGPGLMDKSDTITSYILDHEPVTFTVKYTFNYFLKDIKVVYTKTLAEVPDDAIPAFHKDDPTDLNAYANSPTKVWLVPEWTDVLDERVTYILNVFTYDNVTGYDSIAEGSTATPQYLKMIRHIREPYGITNLRIFRTTDPAEMPSSVGLMYWTSDLSNGKEKDPSVKRYDYLTWETADIPVKT